MTEKKYIGVDIGGTFIKLGIVSERGEVTMRRELPINREPGGPSVMETLFDGIDSLLRKNDLAASDFDGIGVSSAGCIDTASGSIARNCGRVPNWSHAEVVKTLREKYGLRASLVNDGNAVALAESRFGAAAGCRDVICVVIGTGVGGGILSGGRLVEGARGYGGEVGHFPTHAEKKPEHDGDKASHYEYFSATSALVEKARAKNPAWDNGRSIFEAAGAGDEDALALLDEWIYEIAAGLTGLVHIFNPEMIIIGGGVSAQEELLIEPLRKKVFSQIMEDFADGLEIKGATLGNNAGMVGAVRYFMEHNQ